MVPSVVRPRTRALVVGIDLYGTAELGDLSFAAAGARRLAAALTAPDGVALGPERVRCLAGEEGRVLRADLVAALDALVEEATDEDEVLVYFAGHGRATGADFALCTSPDPAAAAVPAEVTGAEVGVALERCRARGVLLVLDCCQGAAFAERAPAVFRRMPRDGHRILLSSCAADESSWELPEFRGTAFTDALSRVCEGALPLGDPPGAVYFSQLLAALQAEVDAVVDEGEKGRRQTVQFAGVYGRDPLVLLHRRLAEAGYRPPLQRFTKEQLRRRIRVTALSVVGAAAAVGGVWYGLLDNSYYAVIEDDRVVVFAGFDGLNSFGFPKKAWESGVGPWSLAAEPPPPGTVLARGWTPSEVARDLEPRLPRVWRALLADWSSEPKAVRELLLPEVGTGDLSGGRAAGALSQLFGSVATRDDVPLLEKLIRSPRDDVRRGAAAGLFRIDPARAVAIALAPPLRSDWRFLADALADLPPSATEAAAKLIGTLAADRSIRSDSSVFVDAALRTGVRLPVEVLVEMLGRERSTSPDSIVSYARACGIDKEFAQALAAGLASGGLKDDRPIALRALALLGSKDAASCCEKCLADENPWTRLAAAAACVRLGTRTVADAAPTCGGEAKLLLELAHLGALAAPDARRLLDLTLGAVRSGRRVQESVPSIVTTLEGAFDRSAEPMLRELLEWTDPNDVPGVVHAAAMRELARLGFESSVAVPFLSAPDQESQEAAYRWRMRDARSTTVEALLARLDDPTADFVVDVLVDADLSAAEVRTVLERYQAGSELVRRRTAAVIAATADVDAVVEVTSDPSVEVRDAALDFACANPAADLVPQRLRAAASFPDRPPRALERDLAMVREAEEQCLQVPEALRSWRAKIIPEERLRSQGARIRVRRGLAGSASR